MSTLEESLILGCLTKQQRLPHSVEPNSSKVPLGIRVTPQRTYQRVTCLHDLLWKLC